MPANSGGMTLRATTQGARQTSGGTAARSVPSDQEARAKSTGVTSVSEARKWLQTNGHIDNVSDTIELDTLKNVLLQLARHADTTIELRDGLWAVAYGLEATSTGALEKTVAAVMGKAMENCKEAIGNLIGETAKSMEGIVHQTKETLSRLEERRGEEISDQAERTDREGGTNWPGRTYAEVTRRAEREDIDHRNKNRSRQLIIDNTQRGESWGGLTERELIEKAKIAKDLMGIQGIDSPKVEFITACKLINGGILYELSTVDAAKWFAKEEVRAAFLDKFSAGAIIKERTFPVIAEFVPVTLEDQVMDKLREIESGNGLHRGELASAKWARPPQARHKSQKVAHLIVACSSMEGANHIIRKGLAIEGKRVMARKLEQEPRRCLKCQRYGKGHLAGECKQEKDTCAICANDHRMKDCKETDPSKFTCVNCKSRGIPHDHPASARSCPAFVEVKARLAYRTLEAKYKYFLTNQT